MTPTVLYEDEDLLIIDKPSGITVNNSDTTQGQGTVQDFLEENFRVKNVNEVKKINSTFVDRAGIAHRLDKETSGILLVARNPDSFSSLQKEFKERRVHKTYLALSHGKVAPEAGEIRVPVGRLPWNRKHFGVLAGGKDAVTRYKRIKNYELGIKNEPLTLLELTPETGRTHQIRVHLKYINHPIFADFLYAGRKTAREDRRYLARVFLHASKIAFLHPRTQKEVAFESPLPSELSNFLETLQDA